jgi:hypothetical protein
MNKKYILINNEKINRPNWIKWLMLIVISYLFLIVISLLENLISKTLLVSIASVALITFFIRGFVVLTLIHDLAPKFKKTISVIWSMLAAFIYLGVDYRAGDRLYLGTLLFIIVIIIYNIFLYKNKTSNIESSKDIS